MKRLKYILPKTVLFLIVFILLSSCAGDDDGDDVPIQSDFFLSAKIDGVDYSRDFVSVSTLADETDVYVISAVGESSSIGLTLDSPILKGTFTPSIGETVALFYQETNPLAIWGASQDIGTGTITITANNTTSLEGTFSFTGINQVDNSTKIITEGSFRAQKL